MMMDLGIASDMGIPAGMLQIGRWVLYDKDGMFVKAVAIPTTYLGKGKVDFGTYDFTCVSISFWDTDYVGMIYELTTGNPKPCYTNYGSWKEAGAYFKDANCTQPAAFVIGGVGSPPSVLQVGGSFFYASANTPLVGTGYQWNKDQNTCTETNINLPPYTFREYKPVPNWVLDIMESPPYTMVLEY